MSIWNNFILIGENFHCTRSVKSGGIKTKPQGDGEAIVFNHKGEEKLLSIPEGWEKISPAYAQGKIKHVALGLSLCRDGKSEEEKRMGEEYLYSVAQNQIESGATYLDVNVDEYSSDPEVSKEMMGYAVEFLTSRFDIPLSIDSSKPEVLQIGVEKYKNSKANPMINSISLERPDVIDLVKQYDADVIVSASGKDRLPSGIDEIINNFTEIIKLLDDAGIDRNKMHLDPLVLPISTDPKNGKTFLEATATAREKFAGVHLTGGLSNVSFGMPNRKLLNIVFGCLCVDNGTDGGIIDPISTPTSAFAEIDRESKPFILAKNFLEGTDEYGMEYIAAHREGELTIKS